ncbi:MAG: tRNA (N6-threonylcarbamoyladenosine(37)-N6)-methyltransferase TrmO [Leptolyngbya sp. SIOISBB]|nr:tRNA (N6-threonylcarbamoyladenosine(37)-N6)-methyltransferase TrmO [Leptolyngbya sp. SIOISBB]
MPKLPPKDYVESVDWPQTVTLQPIGWVRSPYTERHGTPRQSQLSTTPADYEPAIARIELFSDVVPAIALKDLEDFDYLWVIAWLHLNQHWNPTVMPPRGPRVRRGTLATRAPHRPNPIGLSATRIRQIEGTVIHVEGIDFLDRTPVLDIKPYVPYCDAWPQAKAGYVDAAEAAITAETDIFGQAGHPFRQGPSSS